MSTLSTERCRAGTEVELRSPLIDVVHRPSASAETNPEEEEAEEDEDEPAPVFCHAEGDADVVDGELACFRDCADSAAERPSGAPAAEIDPAGGDPVRMGQEARGGHTRW